MRFDDSLATVLAGDASTSLGARAAFIQLTDLIARGRASPEPALLDRLRELRPLVPEDVRASAARGLALADPPAALVALFAADAPAVAGAVLRAARLPAEAWEPLIGEIGPYGRSVLRRRGDLPPSAVRTLERFAVTDHALTDERAAADKQAETLASSPGSVPDARADQRAARAHAGERFEIADLVHRIQQHRRDLIPAPVAAPPVQGFEFETDAAGTIRWIDAAPREPVIGLSLRHDIAVPAVDGVAGGALQRRARFAEARLTVPGSSAIGGEWRIAAAPLFDRSSGRFTGMRGRARRPFVEEVVAAPATVLTRTEGEGLRRLVHELRTPTNAIAGFSELIERELLGPVAPPYRARAGVIRADVDGLIGAIDDIDLTARLQANAEPRRTDAVPIGEVLERVRVTCEPLAARRGAVLSVDAAAATIARGDALTVERLIQRLAITLLGASAPGEKVTLSASGSADVRLTAAWPHALRGMGERALLSLDPEGGAEAPLLGTGFTLRLARRLAAQLDGRLVLTDEGLTLTLPAAFNDFMDTASTQGS